MPGGKAGELDLDQLVDKSNEHDRHQAQSEDGDFTEAVEKAADLNEKALHLDHDIDRELKKKDPDMKKVEAIATQKGELIEEATRINRETNRRRIAYNEQEERKRQAEEAASKKAKAEDQHKSGREQAGRWVGEAPKEQLIESYYRVLRNGQTPWNRGALEVIAQEIERREKGKKEPRRRQSIERDFSDNVPGAPTGLADSTLSEWREYYVKVRRWVQALSDDDVTSGYLHILPKTTVEKPEWVALVYCKAYTYEVLNRLAESIEDQRG